MNRRYFLGTTTGLFVANVALPIGASLEYGLTDENGEWGLDHFTLLGDGTEHRVMLDWVRMSAEHKLCECRFKIDCGEWQKVAGKVTGERSCEFPVLGGLLVAFGATKDEPLSSRVGRTLGEKPMTAIELLREHGLNGLSEKYSTLGVAVATCILELDERLKRVEEMLGRIDPDYARERGIYDLSLEQRIEGAVEAFAKVDWSTGESK